MNCRDICLIQLISEETMQNLLPILALRPPTVFHLSTEKTRRRSDWIIEGARQSGISVAKKEIGLDEMPGIRSASLAVKAAIGEALSSGLHPVVNFTGGTKLMSIGAHQAAQECKVCSLYVDTEHLHFIDGGTASGLAGILANDYSFSPLSRSLNVNSIAVANGSQRVTGGKDWKPYVPVAQHLLGNPDDEKRCWESVFGAGGLMANGKEPRTPSDWLKLWKIPLDIPPEVADPLSGLNMLERRDDGRFYLPRRLSGGVENLPSDFSFAEYSRAVAPAQSILSFLSGGWWEVAVAAAVSQSGIFRDIRWSVNVGAKYSGPDKEEDVVAVQGVQAVYISCKRGGNRARLLGQLDELDNRAKNIGGRFARKFLAVYLPIHGRTAENLYKRAYELGVKILQHQDIKDPVKAFSKT